MIVVSLHKPTGERWQKDMCDDRFADHERFAFGIERVVHQDTRL